MKSLLLLIAMSIVLISCNEFDIGVNPNLRSQGAECRSLPEAFIQIAPDNGYRDNTVYMCVDNFMYLRSDPAIVLGDCNPALVTATNCYHQTCRFSTNETAQEWISRVLKEIQTKGQG